ncbi:MAG: hypothetical protein ACK5Q5_20745 [Planctomycetaceae bacterium]
MCSDVQRCAWYRVSPRTQALIPQNVFARRCSAADATVDQHADPHPQALHTGAVDPPRAVPANILNMETAHALPAPEEFLVYPTPYFKVRNQWLKQYAGLMLIGLTEAMLHLENARPLEISEAFAGLNGQYVQRVYRLRKKEVRVSFVQPNWTCPLFCPSPANTRSKRGVIWSSTRGGRTLYEELQRLDVTTATPAVQESHRELLGYLRNNLHRMDYPTYTARGWQIGSGMIESACKTVVCRRMKVGGMRWREAGTTALCQLRALYRSEPALWTAYWSRAPAA